MRFWSRELRDESGSALVEFALAMPLFLLFYMGGVELTRFILINQKLEKTTSTVADVVAQANSIVTQDLVDLLSASQNLMDPYSFGSNGRIIITSVVQSAAPPALPVVRWQYCGGGTLSATSRIGAVNASASLPTGFTLTLGDDIIIAETFYNYVPIFGNQIVGARSLYKVAYYRPRLGALSGYVSSCP
jgi:hypothetical protein